jgi:hypothetical protein
MGVTSSNFSNNHSDMGSPPDRSVCHQFELQTGDICLSNPRSESLGSGCNDHLLERDVQLHLPTISSSPQEFTQEKRGWLQDHSYSSGLAKTFWFPDLLLLSCAKLLRLPLRGDLSSQFKGKKLRQGLEKLLLHAWLLSGRLSDGEAFLKKQPSASLEQIDSQQWQYMTQNGQSFVLGVCQNNFVLFFLNFRSFYLKTLLYNYPM